MSQGGQRQAGDAGKVEGDAAADGGLSIAADRSIAADPQSAAGLPVEWDDPNIRESGLAAILRNIPGGVAVFFEKDGGIRIAYANAGFYELHHGSREYWSKQSADPVDWLTPGDRHLFEDEFAEVSSNRKEQGSVTYRITGEDGGDYWVCNQFRKAYELGGAQYYYASFIDMDMQISAEQEIREAKHIYDEATRISRTVVWTYDGNGHRANVMRSGYSDEVCRRLAIPETIDGFPESMARYVDERDRDAFLAVYRSIDEGSRSAVCEFRFSMPSEQTERWIHMTVDRLDEGTGAPTVISCTGRDVTDAKRAQDDYDRALHDLLLAVPDALETLHVDITADLCGWSSDVPPSVRTVPAARTLDDLVRSLSEQADDEGREGLGVFGRDALLDSFRRGVDHVYHEYRRLGMGGRSLPVSTHIRMLRNPQNDHIEGVVYTQDISRRVRQEEIFRIITSRSFDLVALIHLDTRVFEAVYLGETLPKAYRRLLPDKGAACSFDAFCAESVLHMDADEREDYEGRLSSAYIRDAIERNGGSYEFTLKEHFPDIARGYMYRRFLHYALRDEPDMVLVIESDVTEEVLRQQELLAQTKAEAERDRRIMDSITVGIAELRLSDQGRLSVDSFNQQIFRMLGYDPVGIPQRIDDARGTPLEAAFQDALTYVYPDDKQKVLRSFQEHAADASFTIEPYRMSREDGSYCWIEQDVRQNEVVEGYRTYYATYRDVTWELEMRNELNRRLQEEQTLREKADAANAAKSDFLSRMSHDIRTPLNGVIGMTYLAREEDNPPRTSEYLSKIDISAKFLLGLINDVLDMTKMESGKVELHPEPYTVDEFNAYLEAVIRPLCDEKGQHFVLDEAVSIDEVPLADKRCTNQVLFNLLSNAVKFTPEGGTITYSVAGRQLPDGRAAIEHRIADTGIGMSHDFQRHLFEPFSQEGRDDTSERRGSGLGLAIVKKLVDLMGGTIEVSSEPGRGTVFTLDLMFDSVPASSLTGSDSEVDAAADKGALEGKRILLCEDHPLNQEIAKALLEQKGVTVDVADDGQRGLERYERSATDYYDAILMDIRMPVMDGYESARAIRGLDRLDARTVPIIAMTADAFADDVQRCLDAGMDGHIAKPIEPDVLFRTLRGFLSAAHGPRAGGRA